MDTTDHYEEIENTNIEVTMSEFIDKIIKLKPANILNFRYVNKYSFNYFNPISGLLYSYKTNNTPLVFNTLRCERNIFLQKINFALRKDKILKLKRNGKLY